MLIYLVLEWKTGLCVKVIELWLSFFSGIIISFFLSRIISLPTPNLLFPPYIISRSCWMCCTFVFCLETVIRAYYWLSYRKPSSVSSSRSHVVFFTTSVRAIYSVLVDNKATVGCFLEYQLTGSPFSIKIKSDIDFWLFSSLAQSELEYLLMSSFS